MRPYVAFAVFAITLATAASAAAQDDQADPQTARARELFQEGMAHVGNREFEEAAVLFREAYVLRPSLPIVFNLGAALAESGELVEGAEMLRQVVRDDAASREMRRSARGILEEIEPRIGQLVVRVEGDRTGAELRIDDRPLLDSQLGVPVSADPGQHAVRAVRGSLTVAEVMVTVGEGGREEITLEVPAPEPELDVQPEAVEPEPEPEPEPIAPPVDLGEDDDSGGGVLSQWWFWTLVGAVVAGGVVTAIVLAGGGVEDPIPGNTDPMVLRFP